MTSVEPRPSTPATTTPAPSATPRPSSTTPSTTASTPSSTTTEPPTTSSAPDRPTDPGPAALYDAIATEHGVIYGYGMVSAHSSPELNPLVSEALSSHRERREHAIALAGELKTTAPLPAVGYQLPITVENPTDAATLAVRMEEDSATAWRAVLEQTNSEEARKLAVTSLTDAAVLAARWRAESNRSPVTVAFPGGTE
ncbi:hypothetical protein MINS_21480 [Mycolicibacterium insubricum]|uniref:DUF4439 domain-containing protein n=1 Tax=Mycolicibacterium insubricum TaxID=444597 RepID=A0A1X0DDV1_9MYCO|nr:ferritin-like domain-containing protein [Mycolicibacterium insubricum]MCB9439882.1 ferritin-like domain-containing protein [Mycolicibacterium sp.]ORA70573.1 hypothetical protein BST26_10395 [Mycolicibacterium insubricum]BBZ66719.1 hypothetical protein MINS_21480 [Mycolicibacterium insubricum]